MANSTNPFLVGEISEEFEHEINVQSLSHRDQTVPNDAGNNNQPDPERVTLDHIAGKLLKDNYILTALELHTELLESGRELPRLRDFFSNPTNFERAKPTELSPTGLVRTSSCQTFDSLDFARYSDDGDRQENDRVAVLEFELRKAQESIKSLRATLTKAAEPEISTPETPENRVEEINGDEPLRSYERRALNFLVNEYMLINAYKITSVTFAEENEDQDFEDWDDVGLNMPKPPDLLKLYRDFGQHNIPSQDRRDVGCMVVMETADEEKQRLERGSEELASKVAQLEDKIFKLTSENEFLAHHVKAMESYWLAEMKKVVEDAETVRSLRQKSSTPAVSPITTPQKKNTAAVRPTQLYRLKQEQSAQPGQEQNAQQISETSIKEEDDSDVIDGVASLSGLSEADQSSKSGPAKTTSTSSSQNQSDDSDDKQASGDQLDQTEYNTADDVIATDALTEQNVKNNNLSSVSQRTETSSMAAEHGTEIQSPVETFSELHTTSDIPESTPNVYRETSAADVVQTYSRQTSDRIRRRSDAFQKALRNTAFQVAHDNRIISEVARLTDSSEEKVILMLGRCLPHIVPNVLLAKREELIPLILCTATLHPDARDRDQLLNILFNLIKRPDAEQRHMILTGCVAFARHVGAERVETELLPQCWEQISHKYAERRLLVAEACGCLAPYLPNEIRSSLVLSMLKQMLSDDKADEVREAVVRSLGLLMGYVDDRDKYPQGAELLFTALRDQSERVQSGVTQVFLPGFAMWALELGCLESHLVQSLMDRIEAMVKSAEGYHKSPGPGITPGDRQQFCMLVHTVQQLVPLVFSGFIMGGPFYSQQPAPREEHIQGFSVSSRFPEPLSDLYDPAVIFGGRDQLAFALYAYETYTGEEWYEPWDAYNWVAGQLVPQLLSLLNVLDVSCSTIVHQMASLFCHLCKTFGRTFTNAKIKNKFQAVLSLPDDVDGEDVSVGQTALTKCTVPVYTAGILGALGQEEDCSVLATFLQDLLRTLALSQVSLDSLRAAYTELGLNPDFHELLLGVLWDGVVHKSSLVRSAAAKMFELLIKDVSETLVSSRVIPALVTLANDAEISVRTSTIPAFGTIMESVTDRAMLDKIHMQLQSFLDDPVYRDHHCVQLELVAVFGRVGPNAEPRFRDDFVLPRLTVMAAANNHVTNETRKRETALQLFDAYSALSCCFISDQLVEELMLPGLRYINNDIHQVAPEMTDVIGSMIRELEDKVESGKIADKSSASITSAAMTPGEDMKSKMLSRFKDVTQSKHNFSNLFKKGK